MQHDLFHLTQNFLQVKPTYEENKQIAANSAPSFYYGIVGVTDINNRLADRYHITIPQLNNAYYQYVPRQQSVAGDGYGKVEQTLKEGDTVLVSFSGGRFEHPLITGTKFHTGNISKYMSALNTGDVDNIPNVHVPPVLGGEALKALTDKEGGSIELEASGEEVEDENQADTKGSKRKRKKNKRPGRLRVRQTGRNRTVEINTGTTVRKNNTIYEQNLGQDRSIAQGLDLAAKKQLQDITSALTPGIQRYLSVAAAESGNVYKTTQTVVPGQIIPKSDGSVVDYNPNTLNTASIGIPGATATYESEPAIDHGKLNEKLLLAHDALDVAEQQAKYEQEVLLPCVENIKNVWNSVQRYFAGNAAAKYDNNSEKQGDPESPRPTQDSLLDSYWKSIKNDFSKAVFDAKIVCDLGSLKVKAAYSPIGSIEQTIDYCAPSWLTTPLLLAQGIFDLACSNAWKTTFTSGWSAVQDFNSTLMICCDDNGLPNLGFNIASSLDFGGQFAINGAPIPLKDTGTLPNSIQLRPTESTVVNLKIPTIISDDVEVKNLVDQKLPPSQIKQPVVTPPPPSFVTPPSPLLTPEVTPVPENNLFDIDNLDVLNKPIKVALNIPNEIPPVVNDSQISKPAILPNDATDAEIALTEPPVNLISYEVSSINYSLDIPASHPSTPLKLSSVYESLDKTAYSKLLNLFLQNGIPNPSLLINELNTFNLTGTLPNFFQTLSLVTRKPVVCLILCLMSVYCQGDSDLNKNIYINLIKQELSKDILNCFVYAEEHDLDSLYSYLNNYYGLNTIDFINWAYNPLLITNWLVTQEPQLQPLTVALYKGGLELFCTLLIKIFNNIDLTNYDSLNSNYVSLVKEVLNLPLEGAGFYQNTMRVFIPEVQYK